MGKTKNKHHSEIQFLRGEVKRLKRENKELKRKLQIYNEDEYVEEIDEIAWCPECTKGELKLIINILNRHIYECSLCDFRTTVQDDKA